MIPDEAWTVSFLAWDPLVSKSDYEREEWVVIDNYEVKINGYMDEWHGQYGWNSSLHMIH